MIMMNNWFEGEPGLKVITVQTSETVLTVTFNIIIYYWNKYGRFSGSDISLFYEMFNATVRTFLKPER